VPVLDIHVHVCKRYDWQPAVREYIDRLNPDFYRLFPEVVTGEGLISHLDEQGVDRAVILAEHSPRATGIVTNDFVSELCKASERLIPFAAIDPEEDVDPAAETERSLDELGCRGLKIMPSYCWFEPDDPRMMPVYEIARDRGIPLMFHMGTSVFPGTRIKYADPLLLDDIADEFPDLTIVVCHGGRPFWYRQTEWMLTRHRNVLVDIAGIPPKHLPSAFPKLEAMSDRFVFGTDWPGVRSISRQVKSVESLPFSRGTIENILWNNAARLLRLDGS